MVVERRASRRSSDVNSFWGAGTTPCLSQEGSPPTNAMVTYQLAICTWRLAPSLTRLFLSYIHSGCQSHSVQPSKLLPTLVAGVAHVFQVAKFWFCAFFRS